MNIGEQIDHYRLDKIISRDSVTTVFGATDLQSGQPVVLKIPHQGMEIDPAFADRFEREHEIGTMLHHPGVLKVLPESHHSQKYLVMEWFDGRPLRQILSAEKKLSSGRALSIMKAICEAVEYIHNHGVVHRDLRPENILVDANNHIKLTDFRVAAKEGAPRLTFTNLAQLIGASAYISPEELKGQRGDARSDIYALGAILYEMLTGRPPFSGTDPYERLTKPLTPPRELEPSISPQLQEVVYRALEREHKDRYPSAHKFAFDLTHLDQVNTKERTELHVVAPPKRSRNTFLYAAIMLIPVIVLGLLLYFARH